MNRMICKAVRAIGVGAAQMKAAVARLAIEDIVAIASYTASLTP
jgi:hypothetical protein